LHANTVFQIVYKLGQEILKSILANTVVQIVYILGQEILKSILSAHKNSAGTSRIF
jgi:hypothetical protein